MDERLLAALASYIDAHYEAERKTRHLCMDDLRTFAGPRTSSIDLLGAINGLLKKMEDSFSEHLLYLIERTGRKPSEIYTKAGVTKAHFSKIRTDKKYHPTKETALAFALALHLSLADAQDLLRRAGYTLSHSSESDLIVEFFIVHRKYNVDQVNIFLAHYGYKPLTNRRESVDSE